jgi:hypothetical protein
MCFNSKEEKKRHFEAMINLVVSVLMGQTWLRHVTGTEPVSYMATIMMLVHTFLCTEA